jgi:hypothetical protein
MHPCRNNIRRYNYPEEYYPGVQSFLDAEPAEPSLGPNGQEPSHSQCCEFIMARLVTQRHVKAQLELDRERQVSARD